MTQRQLAREVKAMTRKEVIMKAIEGRLKWYQAAAILNISERQMRRIKQQIERCGFDAIQDFRGKAGGRKRIPAAVIDQICTLRRAYYADFSLRHFHEFLVEKHGVKISEKAMRLLLQGAKLAEKAPGRGKHRRKRERRPMRGMLLHMDASMHAWVAGQDPQDLIVVMDDADGRILYARLVPQESTMTCLQALRDVLMRFGRFCELYTDRGSHFCTTTHAGQGPDEVQRVQLARALRTLGVRHIRARSPQARGRSERAFRTIQGRLPQELALAGIKDYAAANRYLLDVFIPSFNQKFTVEPADEGSAFASLQGLDIDLALSVQEERVVRNDNTVVFKSVVLQLPSSATRVHFVRLPVTVHQFTDNTLGVSYMGRLLALYDRDGTDITLPPGSIKAAA